MNVWLRVRDVRWCRVESFAFRPELWSPSPTSVAAVIGLELRRQLEQVTDLSLELAGGVILELERCRVCSSPKAGQWSLVGELGRELRGRFDEPS